MQIKYIPVAGIAALGAIAIAIAGTVFAATAAITAGSVGQRAGDPTTFGVSVCNGGSGAFSQVLPMSVTANGETVSANSSSPIPAGGCAYTYLPYASFSMAAGQSYTITVAIDPNATVLSSAPSAVTYNITEPNATTAANTSAPATAPTGLASIFSSIGIFFENLFGKL